MTRSARLCWLISSCVLLLVSACGDARAPNAEPRGTAVTVFIPSAADDWSFAEFTWSLEYQIGCGPGIERDSSSDDFITVEGALEQDEDFDVGPGGPTAVWKGFVEFTPGPCAVQLRLRDADGEVLCTYTEALTNEPESQAEMYFNMVCYATCPTVPLPSSETSPKTFCAPVGGVILSAETPADITRVQSVRYVVTYDRDFLEPNPPFVVSEGSLELFGQGRTDLGAGFMDTNLWEAIVGQVGAGEPHVLELTALDADGAPVCSAETTMEVVSGGIAQVHVVLPCND
ncbi:MAG: hypothetical protein HKN10_11830 [Myxococcales bacterium]|nr:hypothetical protein [Deltaproteobacteria bacterium]NNE19152.1 hypothetical protein [Myxococcales bacterium]